MSPKNMMELITPPFIFCVLMVNGYGFGLAILGAIASGFLTTLVISMPKIVRAAINGWKNPGSEK